MLEKFYNMYNLSISSSPLKIIYTTTILPILRGLSFIFI
jgi:hypothetical protein